MAKAAKSKRIYGGTPLEERVAERRQSLLDAAFEIVGNQGYRALTVRSICKQAGLTDRYFYESFANGEDVLVALHQSLQDELLASMAEAYSQHNQNLEQLVRAGIKAYLDFMRDPRKARILMMEILGVSDAVTDHYLATTIVFSELMLKAYEPLVAGLNAELPERILLGESLLGTMIYVGNTWVMTQYEFPEQMVEDTAANVILSTLAKYA
ncbi:TetR/AcrR family transcriptional regulator [Spongiibacter sp. KMU-158]|uniref:TetR/AcrR family transcriptional regulator n=1 Tax=Spongiibacter pelagi TaxID=2760804 RepID=A0A927C3G3_9GAMM|nr:TetR/AcrR family transcriptional regulator [Spongiibacter pelagi]MBD2858775.1 TetR/AcrR family transcriptional regulator [Spongiibacter pelagi]